MRPHFLLKPSGVSFLPMLWFDRSIHPRSPFYTATRRPPTIITLVPSNRLLICPSPRNHQAHRIVKTALSLKMAVTYPTRPNAMAVKPKSGAMLARSAEAEKARGWAARPFHLDSWISSRDLVHNAPGVRSTTMRKVPSRATTGPLGGVIWSIASFSSTVVVPHNAEARMASSVPGRRCKRRSGAKMPVRASSTSSK